MKQSESKTKNAQEHAQFNRFVFCRHIGTTR